MATNVSFLPKTPLIPPVPVHTIKVYKSEMHKLRRECYFLVPHVRSADTAITVAEGLAAGFPDYLVVIEEV